MFGHEFLTLAGVVSGTLSAIEIISEQWIQGQVSDEDQIQIHSILNKLRIIVKSLQEQALDPKRKIDETVDIDACEEFYRQSIREWRESMDKICMMTAEIMKKYPLSDNSKTQEMLGLIKKRQTSKILDFRRFINDE